MITEINGQELTEEQSIALDEILKEDILERYHNEEYWDQNIIDNFIQNEDDEEEN